MPGELVLDAEVDEPLAVPDSGADIVIDLDVGRSFVFGLEGPLYDFLFVPHLRAVNSTATGSLAGRVFGDADDDGIPEPLEHASITVFRGNPAEPAYTWRVRATGHTGPDGTYTVGFLNAGTHLVQVDAPFSAGLGSRTTSGIVIIAGRETEYSVTLPSFEAASIEIEGPRTVSVGDSTVLRAIVRDANGVIVPNPSVRWQSLDTGVATVTDIGEYATVRAWAPGVATILLTSLGRTDSIGITVSQ